MSTNATPRTYISLPDTAKMIRKELKEAFAGIKFSVRSSRYAGGSSIDVTWTDGPSSGAVNDLIRKYGSKGFDGMIDLQYSYDHWLCPHGVLSVAGSYGHSYASENGAITAPHCEDAEVVSLGAGYVHGQRNISPELRESAKTVYAELTGIEYDDNDWDLSRQLYALLEGTFETYVGDTLMTFNALGEVTSEAKV